MAQLTTAQQEAVEAIRKEFVEVSELADMLGLGYQYTLKVVTTNKYGLGDASVELNGRKLISRQAAQEAAETRQQAAKEAKATED